MGVFLPDTGLWGGILHRVPTWLAVGLPSADQVRLRLPTGQERRVRPLEIAEAIDGRDVSVPFLGEGTVPF
ncbi:hypothetical protein ACFQ0X_21965 [Streptomyces rectiviolaceus]|uniref:hypothetical protein n=1 Tax=Streptomyces rectiviolaceus TaxID=332591 RepID=UPI0031D4FDEE